MLWLWLLDAVDIFLEWIVSWFPALVVPYPETSITFQIPVPGGISVTALPVVLLWTLLVSIALAGGKILTWIYRLIPMNG